MKKVGIITIHNSPNYGACLQSFALYEYIRQQGYDVSIIDLHRPYHYDYKPSKKYVPYKNRFETFTQKCKRCIKRVLHSAVSFMRKEGNKPIILSLHNELTPFDKFNTKISLSRPYYGIDELYANPPVYDTYITGSDQVWNPTQSYCIEPYFLTFAKNGRKISYASSVGIKTLTKKEKNDFSKWLRQYEAVSVREPSAQELLSSISGVEIGQVSDPTFLLDIEYWKKLAVTPSFSEYIMVFTLSFDQSMIEYGLKIAEESGKKLISVNMVQPDDDRYIVIRDASPEEWLGLIEDADMVLTDSFHCTLFSILLGTENFFTYIAPWNIRGSRMEDLLHSVGLLDHLLDIGLRDDFATLSHKMINHDEIAAIVDKERARSRSFLLNNI